MYFFQNFFHKCKLCIVWNWFIEKIIWIPQNSCFEAIQNGSTSGVNRGLSSNLSSLRCANKVKFTEESVMWKNKHVLVKKSLQMGQTQVYHDKPESKRHSIEWKYIDSQIKKKFWAQQSVKRVLQTVLGTWKDLSLLISIKKEQL